MRKEEEEEEEAEGRLLSRKALKKRKVHGERESRSYGVKSMRRKIT